MIHCSASVLFKNNNARRYILYYTDDLYENTSDVNTIMHEKKIVRRHS